MDYHAVVGCNVQNGGNFDACVDRLVGATENYLDEHMRMAIPNIILDSRTDANTKLSFMRGLSHYFYVRGEDGKEARVHCDPDAPRVCEYVGSTLNALLEIRNGNFDLREDVATHMSSLNPMIFAISDNLVLILKPNSENRQFCLQLDATTHAQHGTVKDDPDTLILIRNVHDGDVVNLKVCEATPGDSVIRCLTRMQFLQTLEGDALHDAVQTIKHVPYVFELNYGKMHFYVGLNLRIAMFLRKHVFERDMHGHAKPKHFEFDTQVLIHCL